MGGKKRPAQPTDPQIPKRRRNHRTQTNPWEASREEDPDYEVASIRAERYVKGRREYEVVWVGFEEDDTTWEPVENLAGATESVNAYRESKRLAEEQDKARAAAAKKAQSVLVPAILRFCSIVL